MTPHKIKETALLLFNEKGYEATTMRDISEKVGITAPSIYFHYKSKEELFLEVFEDCEKLFSRCLQEAIMQNANKHVDEQLLQIFRGIIYFYKHNKEAAKHIVRFDVFPVAELQEKQYLIIDSATGYQKSAIANIFIRGIKEGIIKSYTTTQLMTSFYTLYFGYIMQLIRFNLDEDDNEIDLVWDWYWDGIRNRKIVV